MLDGDTAEIKMTIRLDTLVWETREKKVMTDIEESETDDDYVESLPNMTGYVVRKGDTLFLLGKQQLQRKFKGSIIWKKRMCQREIVC